MSVCAELQGQGQILGGAPALLNFVPPSARPPVPLQLLEEPFAHARDLMLGVGGAVQPGGEVYRAAQELV